MTDDKDARGVAGPSGPASSASRAPLTERSRCGIHGLSTANGRCDLCDFERDWQGRTCTTCGCAVIHSRLVRGSVHAFTKASDHNVDEQHHDEGGGAKLATLVGGLATLAVGAAPVFNPGGGWVRAGLAASAVGAILAAHAWPWGSRAKAWARIARNNDERIPW